MSCILTGQLDNWITGKLILIGRLSYRMIDWLIITSIVPGTILIFFIKPNQQNWEYYSLRFSEVQKELAGIKIGLGSPR